MEKTEFLNIISGGEDSKTQFKRDFTNPDSLAAEMSAFSNSGGGKLFIGVSDDGKISGLKETDIRRLNQMISNAASQIIYPPINPLTENISCPDGIVIIVNVLEGINKPHITKDGIIWVKNGADKRKVTSREEIQRIFQRSNLIHADESPSALTPADIDLNYFNTFFEKEYGENLKEQEQELPLPSILSNMNLMNGSFLNTAGALLFAISPQFKLPLFIVKAISYPGTEINESAYIDSRDITGKIRDLFDNTIAFISANIPHIQNGKSVNSVGDLSIPRIVLEEMTANALIHRDYFISAPIRVFVFIDRIEIISPGHLPNNLTVENIKAGNSNIRNPILASFAAKLIPYRGLGTGIIRALKIYPNIDFIDDRENNLFKVIIYRP